MYFIVYTKTLFTLDNCLTTIIHTSIKQKTLYLCYYWYSPCVMYINSMYMVVV